MAFPGNRRLTRSQNKGLHDVSCEKRCKVKVGQVWRVALAAAVVIAFAGTSVRAASRPKSWRQIEKDIQAQNAARIDKGGRISLELIGPQAGKDRVTGPEAAVDGNPHSRCVTWGVPIMYRIELVDKLPVTEINFICSDYASGESPKDVEVTLSDGTVVRKTLEVIRPERNKVRPRQKIEVNKDIEWVEVKILSVHPSAINPKTGKPYGYGGIGEIEVITSADLTPYLTVSDFNRDAPSYVEGGSPRSDYSAVKVTLPSEIPLGQYPGIYLTRDEIVKMRETMKSDPRTEKMMGILMPACDEWLGKEIVHPDPKVPAQMRDRGDEQARAHDLMSKMAGWLGWAYQLTDDERYAEKAREILVGYARLYPNDYKEHKGVHSGDTSKVMAQRLSEAMWMLPLIQSYDMIHDAKCMSDEDRKLIENDLIRTAVTFINGKRTGEQEVARRDRQNPDWRTAEPAVARGAVGNWTNFYNAAYLQAGIVLGDQNWIDIAAANTKYNIANGIGEDGMWKEGAIGYQLFARHALVACLEPLARKGIDLYSYNKCQVKNLWDSPIKYAYPDSTAPGINDSGRSPVGGSWTAMAYDYAYLRYGDPNYGKLVNDAMRQVFQSSGCYFPTRIYETLPEMPIKGLGSVIFGDLGYAVLRGKDAGDETFLLMDYGPHGGGHGHPDKLNLILFADGDELAGEPQSYRYEDARHREWTRPTVAHWSVSVDLHEQAPTTGKLLCFYDAGAVKVMRGVSDGAYPGVALDRTVVQMPGYVADVFRAWGPAVHTFDYPLCFRGALDVLKGVDPAELEPMGPETMRGYKHVLARQVAAGAADWAGTWTRPAVAVEEGQEFDESVPDDDRRTHPANEVRAVVLGAEGTTVYAGTVPGGRHQAILRRKGREATFGAVIDPYKASDAVASVEQLTLAGPVRAYGLKVKRADGGTDLIVVRYDQQTGGQLAAPTTFEGGRTNALVSVVRIDADGRPVELGMLGGTELFFGGKGLKLDAPGIAWSE